MDKSSFLSCMPGEFVNGLDGRLTFAPLPLYPHLNLTPEIQEQISQVLIDLGRLDGMSKVLPDPSILIRPFVRREAQLSSYIENTFASYDEVASAAQNPDQQAIPEQVRETLNAEQAIFAGVQAVLHERHPINNVLIRHLHSMLLSGTRGHHCRGAFREKQVYIGDESRGIDVARFVPPAPHLVPRLMSQFEQAWSSGREHFALVRIALLHYQFETIHPFEDGNGRLGRMLTLLGLCSFGMLGLPLLNPSIHFERHRQRYYDGLLRVSTHADWTGWITFFLEGLLVAAIESRQKLEELLNLQRTYHALVRSARNSALLLTLVDRLFIQPVLTINDAAEVMGVTHAAARSSVHKLLDAGILQVRSSGKPARYAADMILKAVNAVPTRR